MLPMAHQSSTPGWFHHSSPADRACSIAGREAWYLDSKATIRTNDAEVTITGLAYDVFLVTAAEICLTAFHAHGARLSATLPLRARTANDG
jgi:hypothetical protein